MNFKFREFIAAFLGLKGALVILINWKVVYKWICGVTFCSMFSGEQKLKMIIEQEQQATAYALQSTALHFSFWHSTKRGNGQKLKYYSN